MNLYLTYKSRDTIKSVVCFKLTKHGKQGKIRNINSIKLSVVVHVL